MTDFSSSIGPSSSVEKLFHRLADAKPGAQVDKLTSQGCSALKSLGRVFKKVPEKLLSQRVGKLIVAGQSRSFDTPKAQQERQANQKRLEELGGKTLTLQTEKKTPVKGMSFTASDYKARLEAQITEMEKSNPSLREVSPDGEAETTGQPGGAVGLFGLFGSGEATIDDKIQHAGLKERLEGLEKKQEQFKGLTIVRFNSNQDMYEDYGSEAKKQDEIEFFLERGANVVVFNYPGVGDKDTGPATPKTMKAAEEALMNHVNENFPDTQMVLWGRSLGGARALENAQKGHHLLLDRSFTSLSKAVRHFDLPTMSGAKKGAGKAALNLVTDLKLMTLAASVVNLAGWGMNNEKKLEERQADEKGKTFVVSAEKDQMLRGKAKLESAQGAESYILYGDMPDPHNDPLMRTSAGSNVEGWLTKIAEEARKPPTE